MENKNKEKLASLTTFMIDHPELRFWQGVLAWANEYYKGQHDTPFSKLFLNSTDTFYWE